MENDMSGNDELDQGSRPDREMVNIEPAEDEPDIVEALVADLGDILTEYQQRTGFCFDTRDLDLIMYAIVNEARAKLMVNDLDHALQIFECLELLCRGTEHYQIMYIALEMQAGIHWERCDIDGAWPVEKKKEQFYRALGDAKGVQSALLRQASILKIKAGRGESVAGDTGKDLAKEGSGCSVWVIGENGPDCDGESRQAT